MLESDAGLTTADLEKLLAPLSPGAVTSAGVKGGLERPGQRSGDNGADRFSSSAN